jgi:hypothetical protein
MSETDPKRLYKAATASPRRGRSTFERLAALPLLALGAVTAVYAEAKVGVSIGINQPRVYCGIDIGITRRPLAAPHVSLQHGSG